MSERQAARWSRIVVGVIVLAVGVQGSVAVAEPIDEVRAASVDGLAGLSPEQVVSGLAAVAQDRPGGLEELLSMFTTGPCAWILDLADAPPDSATLIEGIVTASDVTMTSLPTGLTSDCVEAVLNGELPIDDPCLGDGSGLAEPPPTMPPADDEPVLPPPDLVPPAVPTPPVAVPAPPMEPTPPVEPAPPVGPVEPGAPGAPAPPNPPAPNPPGAGAPGNPPGNVGGNPPQPPPPRVPVPPFCCSRATGVLPAIHPARAAPVRAPRAVPPACPHSSPSRLWHHRRLHCRLCHHRLRRLLLCRRFRDHGSSLSVTR